MLGVGAVEGEEFWKGGKTLPHTQTEMMITQKEQASIENLINLTATKHDGCGGCFYLGDFLLHRVVEKVRWVSKHGGRK